ncbi:large ribosomal subunit protein mL66 [Euwallacea fornicatus]|uniref:large ribosomal subunit protein mL66 n=1 Tax=Euwallacea fornicatus TaxID=995702 RepID=UPI00338F2F56
MNLPRKLLQGNNLKTLLNLEIRPLTTTSVLNIKEIKEVQKGNELVIYGEYSPSAREPFLLKNIDPSKCPVCASGLDIKHTDVLILSQFLRSDGCMLPRRITGLCKMQQKRVGTLVTMAQKAGLMANIGPAWSKKDPKTRYRWKRYNKYFDESTIKC